jgi:hypothetical protein
MSESDAPRNTNADADKNRKLAAFSHAISNTHGGLLSALLRKPDASSQPDADTDRRRLSVSADADTDADLSAVSADRRERKD